MSHHDEPTPSPKLGGVERFSSCDYPGKLACVVFVSGCPWRCHYCHNPHLQTRNSAPDRPSWPSIAAWLERRKGMLDAVVFCGGEPLVERFLPSMMAEVKALGFRVALHTGGGYPDRLAACLPLIDWIGFDVKAPFERYADVTQIARSGDAARRSLDLIVESGIEFECRTTIHPALLTEDDLVAISTELVARGITKLVLQPFRRDGVQTGGPLDAPLPADYPPASTIARLQQSLSIVEVRAH
ncbi:anaerobic ribonucleoside-triphosphate reductase activating protein [Paraburkholderia tropica]|uniref:anaerobic ribonucleoside-triphosphate reductase activating protein n=1 Tax=Paraburkholderia tropica TaxID=92647 RepID=UPI002AB6351B|nr:anaerobic ribonucleoside-triphosphate reductase activating protein [Paraburkholderia tropica]